MKKFSLEEYLKNPDRKIITRNGRNVRIICTDKEGTRRTIVALVKNNKGEEIVCSYFPNGVFSPEATNDDLFFVPEKKTGWINVSRISSGNAGEITYAGAVYPTKEEAIAGYSGVGLLDTIQIEWEE